MCGPVVGEELLQISQVKEMVWETFIDLGSQYYGYVIDLSRLNMYMICQEATNLL